MPFHHHLFALLVLLMPVALCGQVVNDDINRRLPLPLNTSLTSNTTNCTVQWNCINPKAVSRCILFHNDQWFEFTTQDSGAYYLTITKQSCRDIRGVQVLVIDGEPCKPSTYQHLVCYSSGTQDDIALTLDSLQANHTYLINIDGYLNDFCHFEISLRTQVPDFAVFPLPEPPPVSSMVRDNIIELLWTLSDSLKEELTEFYILRRHVADKKSREITRFAALTNTYGMRQTTYSYQDTVIKEGVYTYKVIGSTNTRRNYLLKELTIHFIPNLANTVQPEDVLTFEIPVKKRLNVRILLFNAQTEELLKQTFMMTSARYKNEVRIDITPYKQAGIHQFRIMVKEQDKPNGYEKSFVFTK